MASFSRLFSKSISPRKPHSKGMNGIDSMRIRECSKARFFPEINKVYALFRDITTKPDIVILDLGTWLPPLPMYGASSLAHLLRPDWAELPILWAASLLGMPYLRESRRSKISMKLEPSPFCRGISFGWLSGFGRCISKPFSLVPICLNSGDLALAYAITAKPDSSLYPDPYSFFLWLLYLNDSFPFPTGDDDRYFLSQFHSGTAFLAFPALPDWLLFCSNLYSCSCKRIRSSLLLKSIWSSSILSILFSPFCRSKARNLSYSPWEISRLG